MRSTRSTAQAVTAAALWCLSSGVLGGTFVGAQLDRPSGIFDGGINEVKNDPAGSTNWHIEDAWGRASAYASTSYGTF
jgi:hypothetical protein